MGYALDSLNNAVRAARLIGLGLALLVVMGGLWLAQPRPVEAHPQSTHYVWNTQPSFASCIKTNSCDHPAHGN